MKFSCYIKVRNGKPYFRMAVPADVRFLAGNTVRKEICFRLPTDSIGEANRKAAELAEYFTAHFNDVRRRLRPVAPPSLTKRVVKALTPFIEITTKRAVLAQDDQLRDHGVAQVGEVLAFSAERQLRRPTTASQLIEQSRALIDEQVARMAQDPTAPPARGIAEVIVGTTLGATNVELDETSEASDEMQALLRVAREAVLSAYRDRQVRYHGIAVPTPAQAEVDVAMAQANGLPVATPGDDEDPSLDQIFQLWKARRGTNPKSVDSYRSTLCELASFVHPEATAEVVLSACRASDVTPRLALRFIEKQGSESGRRGNRVRTPATVANKLSHLKAMFHVAQSNLLLPGGNPLRDLTVDVPRNRPPTHKSFTPDAERRIFTHPLFTRLEMPGSRDAGGAAAFWIPLLMWKGGMRPNELCQAAASNVKFDGTSPAQIAYLEINNQGGRRTKNRFSNRRVPIHDDLIGLGFLDYWASIPRDGFLFPDLLRDKYGRSERFSDWFNQTFLRHTLGIADTTQVLKSFRHGFIEKCRNAEMAPSTRLALVGHGSGNPVDDGYGDEVCISTKHAGLMRVRFEPYPIAHW